MKATLNNVSSKLNYLMKKQFKDHYTINKLQQYQLGLIC